MPIVYVYGTLRPEPKNIVLVPGELYEVSWFPGACLMDEATTESRIVCERVEVSDETLARLDRYEGYNPQTHDGLFLRKSYKDGFIYTYNGPMRDCFRISSGDWLYYTNERSGQNAHLLARG
jgi:gamma-glutamylcyclotransferase (GGCT)/AIG2-like uncharacterized protein YtfP